MAELITSVFSYLGFSISNIIIVTAHFVFASYAGIAQALSNSPTFVLQSFVYAFIGGLFPALIWLWFWMHENLDHREPKYTLRLTFLAGMCAVLLVFPFQKLIAWIIGGEPGTWTIIFLWAALEELFKYWAAYFFALRNKSEVFDEPIDAFVYLMTAALGFAALENTLFLIGPLLQGNTLSSILVGNMRFMGANLLHVASSGLLSLFIAFAYFKPVWKQRLYTIIGLFVAFLFHAGFNFLLTMIDNGLIGKEKIFLAFSFVWITLIILILALEKVKKIKEF
ncbi:MAG: PrsW family intramembrane metalloprotease [Candidatus Pacebacteria bacterium]|nr:PrsW family intramembrane metalloprotease [Candidatus Paceibacterota bacterium]